MDAKFSFNGWFQWSLHRNDKYFVNGSNRFKICLPPRQEVKASNSPRLTIYSHRWLRSRLNGVLATDGAFLTVPCGHQEVTS